MAKKFKLPISIVELVVYTLSGLMAVWGLVYISLGVAVNFLKYDNKLVETNAAIAGGTNGMGFLQQGILVLFIGVAVAVVFLLSYAKVADRQYEKEQRRAAARFNRKNNASESQEVVEVESTPVEE